MTNVFISWNMAEALSHSHGNDGWPQRPFWPHREHLCHTPPRGSGPLLRQQPLFAAGVDVFLSAVVEFRKAAPLGDQRSWPGNSDTGDQMHRASGPGGGRAGSYGLPGECGTRG